MAIEPGKNNGEQVKSLSKLLACPTTPFDAGAHLLLVERLPRKQTNRIGNLVA
jgi:hypothetical protein